MNTVTYIRWLIRIGIASSSRTLGSTQLVAKTKREFAEPTPDGRRRGGLRPCSKALATAPSLRRLSSTRQQRTATGRFSSARRSLQLLHVGSLAQYVEMLPTRCSTINCAKWLQGALWQVAMPHDALRLPPMQRHFTHYILARLSQRHRSRPLHRRLGRSSLGPNSPGGERRHSA